MFERNPHYKLFNKACKYWDNASKGGKIDADGYHDDYDAALFQFDKLLILIQEEGDIL